MFDVTPIIQSSLAVQVHIFTAVCALFLGAVLLWNKKGDLIHKNFGKLWAILIIITAVSSFWIDGINLVGPFSPIHLLSIYALYAVFTAVRQARAGQIDAHQKTMKNLYYFAIIGAGIFALLPGRMMHQIVFG